ncbi:uncharacterized protein K460DRAFT_129921 [Cucurbitaria berberidis CBS 394.84]|uniref:tRNA(Phe) (4-demethylwyosine(37)-C(7)) aminocarboxypropyltransferase n=1 Tax=Cucurbitaria berberidis CBS 394.84 TaxID=1168544 RepID=A0A9P4L976_9PLEO|nr:uncharacterized protein K460DRAFT_129921 [Cucurbitaria berberidis CBS 394.84]KAF1846770.1 hypothetical protein K460DRAFT_129921 [Cucurbitaria berberidis CBS 394.84]
MSDQPREESAQRRVVLEVPKAHVKTVKSALEKFGQLDRTRRIAPGTKRDSIAAIPGAPGKQQLDARDDIHSDLLQDSIATSTPGTLPEDAAATSQFPVLKFDPGSGQYVDPAVLRQEDQRIIAVEDPSATPQFPTLKFDPVSGQYADPAVLQRKDQSIEAVKDPSAPVQFPALKFDPISGQYVDPVVLQQEDQSIDVPVLKFDPVSGQYVDPAVLRQEDQSIEAAEEHCMRIPTTIPYALDGHIKDDTSQNRQEDELKSKVLKKLALGYLFNDISISHQVIPIDSLDPTLHKNPLQRALKEALEALPQSILMSRGLTVEGLVSSFPDSYSVYRPMLLLPHNAFASDAWNNFMSAHAANSDSLRPVWQRIAEAVGATHIAVNSPIPLQTSTKTAAAQDQIESQAQENFLRSPVNLAPIYGDFGPLPTPQTLSSPNEADFKNALWVTTIQNGIHQTWAPLYTMFSRGNVSEKTRLLTLPSVTMDFDVPSAAVDLYAGIGYFAFSYKKGGAGRKNGIEKILCWELNPWSVEGLRRGAEMNRWTCRIWGKNEMPVSQVDWETWRRELEKRGDDEDFWIFQMSNEFAGGLIQHLTTPEPPLVLPIRHVNLGLLPSSTRSWRTAMRVLDIECGGWIHAHENVGVQDIESRSRELEDTFQGLLEERGGKRLEKDGGKCVKLEHVERVKMYAPGVVHCVFDVYVPGAS